MFFFTKIFVIKKPAGKAEETDVPAEEPAAEESIAEEAEEAAEETEIIEAEAIGGPEVDVISTEGADEVDDNDNIVVPVVLDKEAINEKVAEEELDVSKFGKSRYTRTYESKLIQSDDELKGYYSIIKNAFMSYKKVTCSISREHERVRLGRTTIGIIQIRGKTILLYLALEPGQFEGTMYTGDDVSGMTKYEATPFLYKVNGPRKAKRAARLVAMIAKKLEMEPTATPANEDYVAKLPYESTEALVKKGLIFENTSKN